MSFIGGDYGVDWRGEGFGIHPAGVVGLVSFATFCGVDFSSNLGWGAIISGGWAVKSGGFFRGYG